MVERLFEFEDKLNETKDKIAVAIDEVDSAEQQVNVAKHNMSMKKTVLKKLKAEKASIMIAMKNYKFKLKEERRGP